MYRERCHVKHSSSEASESRQHGTRQRHYKGTTPGALPSLTLLLHWLRLRLCWWLHGQSNASSYGRRRRGEYAGNVWV